MSENNRLPKFPDSYIGDKAKEYNNSKWMERNQKKTTLLCIQYLYDTKLDLLSTQDILEDKEYIILDLGCGTGFSSEVLAESGFRVIGVDMLKDMLYKAKIKAKDYSNYNNVHYILADINYLPLKENSIDHIISVSAYNFIVSEKRELGDKLKTLNNVATTIYKILKQAGRAVIEFYPKDEKELELFTSSFKKNNFNGFIVKSNLKQKSGQQFLLLKKK
ncbi:MAG: class I SAM-dependent methyltransferase [Candidatus Lokiarchaeota archaeon]|nr:class I SAM-dependent methyltransferase [Candidatus Lokiarchaeota archaeon]